MSNKQSNVVHVTTDQFEAEVLESDIPVVVDFWAPWCGPCRAIAPVLDTLSERYKGRVKVAKVNVDEEPALAQAFRVTGIPTLLSLEGRTVTAQVVGFGGKAGIEAMFEELLESKTERATG